MWVTPSGKFPRIFQKKFRIYDVTADLSRGRAQVVREWYVAAAIQVKLG